MLKDSIRIGVSRGCYGLRGGTLIQSWRGSSESRLPREVAIQAESQVGKLQGAGQGRVLQAEGTQFIQKL